MEISPRPSERNRLTILDERYLDKMDINTVILIAHTVDTVILTAHTVNTVILIAHTVEQFIRKRSPSTFVIYPVCQIEQKVLLIWSSMFTLTAIIVMQTKQR